MVIKGRVVPVDHGCVRVSGGCVRVVVKEYDEEKRHKEGLFVFLKGPIRWLTPWGSRR